MIRLFVMVGERLLFGVITLLAVSIIIASSVELLPGDVATAILGQAATPETVAALRKQLGLDLPFYQRYWEWLWNFLQGDMGVSLTNERPVAPQVGERFANTLLLAALAAVIAVPLSLALGIVAAIYRGGWFDKLISSSTLAAISMPEFLVGYIVIAIFAVELGWFPSISTLRHDISFLERIYVMLLPCITLALVVMAHMMRLTRAAIINLLASPYIEMARLKGVGTARLIVYHALPNALSPIITVIVLNLAYLIVGVVVVEVVFVYPGLGQLLVDSVSARNLPVVQASCLIFAGTYVTLNLLADVFSALANPRLRHPR